MDIEQIWKENQKGSITMNRGIMTLYGKGTSIFWGELLSRYRFFANQNKLVEGGYCYVSIPKMQAATDLTRREQDAAIANLVAAGVLETKFHTGRARRFRINLEAAGELLNHVHMVQGSDNNHVHMVQGSDSNPVPSDTLPCTHGTDNPVPYVQRITTSNYENNYNSTPGQTIFDLWNEKCKVKAKQNKSLDKLIEHAICQDSEDMIRQAIINYAGIFNDPVCAFYTATLKLEQFLKKTNGRPKYEDFLEGGWIYERAESERKQQKAEDPRPLSQRRMITCNNCGGRHHEGIECPVKLCSRCGQVHNTLPGYDCPTESGHLSVQN